MSTAQLGERELQVMMVLWKQQTGTVPEVRHALGAPLAYTTVLTILRNLEAKGFVTRDMEGRAHRYRPIVAQRAERQRAVSRLIDTLFLGSPEALLSQLVEDHKLSAELARIASRREPPHDYGGAL